MEFLDTYIQRNSSKLKLFVFFYFPLTSCKKGDGWSFMAHMYKEIVQNENWFFFCYFHVTSCKKESEWSFQAHISKEIVQK